ncbi:MAG: hypothetical protein U5L96_05340 [Owenweeksia sp.]|nr:hypothetical protein [Owenweeksia sp.]
MACLKYTYLLVASLIANGLSGQELRIKMDSATSPGLVQNMLKYEGTYRDSLELAKRLQAVRMALYTKGFLLSEATLEQADSNYQLLINPGPQIIQNQLLLKISRRLHFATNCH